MPLAKWTTERFNIFFSLVLLQGKKNIRAQHLDKKNINSGETLKKKKSCCSSSVQLLARMNLLLYQTTEKKKEANKKPPATH